MKGEPGRGFSATWESEFLIEGGCVFTRSAGGTLTAWPGYAAEDTRKAMLRAGKLRP